MGNGKLSSRLHLCFKGVKEGLDPTKEMTDMEEDGEEGGIAGHGNKDCN